MALRITEQWIRERVKLKHDNLDDVKSLSLPGSFHEKISLLGSSLTGFTRLKSLDLSRNALGSTEELDLRLNPVTKNEPDYRLFIVHMLPNLRRLDDRSVRDSERRAAIMHFTSDQASDFDHKYTSNSKVELERLPLPRTDMIYNLNSHPAVLEDDDVAILDLISRVGGDLTQPRGLSGSATRVPDVDSYTRDELHKMFPPAKTQEESKNPSTDGRDLRPTLLKDRAYVHFADDDFGLSNADPNLKYADEISTYTAISTRGHFTPNPRMINYNVTPSDQHHNSHLQSNGLDEPKQNLPIGEERRALSSARSYELSPSRKRTQPSPKQSQGPLADKIGKAAANSSSEDKSPRIHTNRANLVPAESGQGDDQESLLNNLLDLVDKYWNGSKSLQRHSKFKSLAQKLLSSHLPGTMDRLPITPSLENDKLQEELTERTVEISRMRDQMSQQQNELEEVRSKLKNHEATKNSLDAVTHSLSSVQSQLLQFQEENNSLRSKIRALETASQGLTEQERLIGELQHRNLSLQEEVKTLNQQIQQQNINLQQLQELTNMLQESHRSLVSTNDHLLRELDDTRLRHQHEIHQMHWSYDNLKKTMDWLPNGSK
ncbi:Centrosomal protein of 72 kDa [Acropora cervicornis]|uniref:Centrosomal protein of 72 kDa n=1 Tax=Acropora cervicornis TaxID=6130 RepID=A0AAD9Q965_ACRCE|nr:Centrosomal protein of 72 kDa [Acropora cervicornis]